MFFHSSKNVGGRVHSIPQNKYHFTVRRRTNKNAESTADTEEVLSFSSCWFFFCFFYVRYKQNRTSLVKRSVESNASQIYFTVTSAGHVFFAERADPSVGHAVQITVHVTHSNNLPDKSKKGILYDSERV